LWWRPINFALHSCWLIAFIVLVKDYHFVDPALYDAVLGAKQRDVFALAVQLGRLDFMNSVLALLALVIAGGAVFGILEVRKAAEMRAESTAKAYLDREAPRLFDQAVKAQGRKRNKPDLGEEPFDETSIIEEATEIKDGENGKLGA